MRVVSDRYLCDVECPYCGVRLEVEDPCDFECRAKMEREEDYKMMCPVCEEFMTVHVEWEPTYPYGAEAVSE